MVWCTVCRYILRSSNEGSQTLRGKLQRRQNHSKYNVNQFSKHPPPHTHTPDLAIRDMCRYPIRMLSYPPLFQGMFPHLVPHPTYPSKLPGRSSTPCTSYSYIPPHPWSISSKPTTHCTYSSSDWPGFGWGSVHRGE